MKKIKLTTPMSELTTHQKRRLCRYGIVFCRKQFGAPLSKMPISYSIAILPGNQDFYGQYNPEDNRIHVFSRNTETIKQFIMTFIHEYVHSTQPIKEHYNRLLNIYGYDEHPYEIEAEAGASNYYSKFWSGFKNSYHFKLL
jgi:hypothetical protein